MTATAQQQTAPKRGEPGYIPPLVPQKHGGALRAGGTPGHKFGGGRTKDTLRELMRENLEKALHAMAASLAGERLASEALKDILDDEDLQALGQDGLALLAEVLPRYLTATLTNRELVQMHDTLAKYGVGIQAEIEQTNTRNFVVRLPQRDPLPPSNADPAARAASAPRGLKALAGASRVSDDATAKNDSGENDSYQNVSDNETVSNTPANVQSSGSLVSQSSAVPEANA